MEAESLSAKIENKNGILFSTGATGDNERHFAQDKESHLGKFCLNHLIVFLIAMKLYPWTQKPSGSLF